MDTFRSFTWNVPPEEEPEFASAEDFKSKSITYKILHGSFKTELSSDSSDEPMKKSRPKKTSKKKNKTKKSKTKSCSTSAKENENSDIEEGTACSEDGVPYSTLNATQHASYVAMLYAVQQHQSSISTKLMKMKEIVEQEQMKFLEYIKELWKTAYEKHHVLVNGAQRLTEDEWKSQLKRVKLYPQFYASLKNIPLVYPEDQPEVQLVPLQMLLEMGVVPKLHIPSNPNIPTKVCTDYAKLLLLNAPCPEDANTLHHVPVSADKNAEILVVKEKADIVISSSGLKCIADNISSKCEREWCIPFVVKEYSIKDVNATKKHKVVYIDKRLPSKSMSAYERNEWFHKLAIKCSLCNHRDPMSFRYPERQLNDLNVEFTNAEVQKPQNNRTDGSYVQKISKDNLDDSSSDSSDLVIDEHLCSDDAKDERILEDNNNSFIKNNSDYSIVPPSSKTNVTYRLWKLNCQERQKEDLNEKFLKGQSSPKELRVLVRCKMDACEHENNQVLPVHMSCKLEYQAEFGAEKINLPSLVREWVDLLIRPEAVLRRIRIDAMTEEVIMTEKIMLRDLSLMALHFHNLRIRRTVLGSLYQVMKELVTLNPGQYLLSHVRNGLFTTVLQQTNSNFNYNLYADYESVNPGLIKADAIPQWTPIDTNFCTPKQIARKQIPATFQPKQPKNK